MRFSAAFVGHAADPARAASSAAEAARRAQAALADAAWPTGVHVEVQEDHHPPVAEGRLELRFADPVAVRLVGRLVSPDPDLLPAAVDRAVALLHDAAHDAAGPVDLDLLLTPAASNA